MPLRSEHPQRLSPSGTPMRRYQDYEPGDTFRYKGREYFKCQDGISCTTDPNEAVHDTITPSPGQWLCEF